ncbi:MAG: multicopper oxidase domain-containing protein, partial [Planctomycetaceae bacterium]
MTTVWGYNGSYPGVTIEAQSGVATRVRFTNALPQKHLLPIDPTLDGAFNYMLNTPNPEVRTITHLHGGHSRPEHDGFPEHWYVPGSSRDHIYDNNQPASTLWYHDHAMGSTRLNVYAGLAGFYLIRDKVETALNLPRGTFEVPLAIQDRCFNADGSLFYPTSREYFDG